MRWYLQACKVTNVASGALQPPSLQLQPRCHYYFLPVSSSPSTRCYRRCSSSSFILKEVVSIKLVWRVNLGFISILLFIFLPIIPYTNANQSCDCTYIHWNNDKDNTYTHTHTHTTMLYTQYSRCRKIYKHAYINT